MTSKRNSRIFDDDGSQQDRGLSSATASLDTSRRTSRTSSIEDMHSAMIGKSAGEQDDGARSKTSTNDREATTGPADGFEKTSSSSVDEKIHSTASSTTLSSNSSSVAANQGRMANFGVVSPGVYRSSYPLVEHFDFCRSLGLRTVVTLVNKQDERSVNLGSFVRRYGIRHVVFNMQGTKKEDIPHHTMQAILEIVHDKSYHPLLIHCNQGKHRTGCVVAASRKVSGWPVDTVLHEYRTFAEPKVRDCDVAYISALQVSSVHKDTAQPTSSPASYGPASPRAFRRRAFVRLFALTFGTLMVVLCSSWQWNLS